MGTYDRISVYTECPYCGKHKVFDAQTKDLDKSMKTYRSVKPRQRKSYKGNLSDDFDADTKDTLKGLASAQISDDCFVPEEYRGEIEGLRATFSCDSVQCQFDADRDWILIQGSPSGFGRSFDATIKVADDGMIVTELSDVELAEYKEEYPEIFEHLKDKYEHEPIITRNWHKGRREVEGRE